MIRQRIPQDKRTKITIRMSSLDLARTATIR